MKVLNSNPIRILLVDQNPDYFNQVIDQIEMNSHLFQFSVRYINEISEARESLSSWSPNLVVLDCASPSLLAAELVQGCNQLEVPVVITGDLLSAEIEARIKRIGASAFIVKSEDPEDLEKVLELFSETATTSHMLH